MVLLSWFKVFFRFDNVHTDYKMCTLLLKFFLQSFVREFPRIIRKKHLIYMSRHISISHTNSECLDQPFRISSLCLQPQIFYIKKQTSMLHFFVLQYLRLLVKLRCSLNTTQRKKVLMSFYICKQKLLNFDQDHWWFYFSNYDKELW